ncbi:MAG: signal peptidase I [Actinobacteria bacterium]|nr:signal peptidase I [Actinomycetota bacterium]
MGGKTLRRIIDAASWIVLAVIVLLVLTLILSAFNIGVRAFVVSSGSMSPSIHTGDLVFVRKCGVYKKGETITFVDSNNKYITHRVYEVEEENGKNVYITKGDANEIADGSPVNMKNVMGKVVFRIPYIGVLIAFFHTRIGLSLLIIGIGAMLLWLVLTSKTLSGKGETVDQDRLL